MLVDEVVHHGADTHDGRLPRALVTEAQNLAFKSLDELA